MLIEAIKTAIDNYAECGMATRSFSGVRHPEIRNWSGSIKGSGWYRLPSVCATQADMLCAWHGDV